MNNNKKSSKSSRMTNGSKKKRTSKSGKKYSRSSLKKLKEKTEKIPKSKKKVDSGRVSKSNLLKSESKQKENLNDKSQSKTENTNKSIQLNEINIQTPKIYPKINNEATVDLSPLSNLPRDNEIKQKVKSKEIVTQIASKFNIIKDDLQLDGETKLKTLEPQETISKNIKMNSKSENENKSLSPENCCIKSEKATKCDSETNQLENNQYLIIQDSPLFVKNEKKQENIVQTCSNSKEMIKDLDIKHLNVQRIKSEPRYSKEKMNNTSKNNKDLSIGDKCGILNHNLKRTDTSSKVSLRSLCKKNSKSKQKLFA